MTKDKVEYQIIESNDPTEFVRAVESSLNNGWELYGNLCVLPPTNPYDYIKYIQAMIRRTFYMHKMSEEREASNVSQG